MQFYVNGFAFSKDYKKVILMKKEKPEWQKGFLNGIGGKVEKSDSSFKNAMAREFKEETGVYTLPDSWNLFCSIRGKDFYLEFFSSQLSDKNFELAKTIELEIIKKIPIKEVFTYPTVNNLSWLIPLALNIEADKSETIVVYST